MTGARNRTGHPTRPPHPDRPDSFSFPPGILGDPPGRLSRSRETVSDRAPNRGSANPLRTPPRVVQRHRPRLATIGAVTGAAADTKPDDERLLGFGEGTLAKHQQEWARRAENGRRKVP